MVILEVLNSPEQNILSLIKKSQSIFGIDTLSGGNCGMFALAIGRILQDKNITTTLGFLIRDDDGEYNNLRDAQAGETDFYHVVIEYKGKMFDGTGMVTKKQLLAMANDEYGDSNPRYLGQNTINDRHALSVIDNDTNWTIPASNFLVKLT